MGTRSSGDDFLTTINILYTNILHPKPMEDFQACFVRIKQPNVFFFQTIQDLTMNQLCWKTLSQIPFSITLTLEIELTLQLISPHVPVKTAYPLICNLLPVPNPLWYFPFPWTFLFCILGTITDLTSVHSLFANNLCKDDLKLFSVILAYCVKICPKTIVTVR